MCKSCYIGPQKSVYFFQCEWKGLNMYSMLKHQILVLTLAARERIEEHIFLHLHWNDALEAEGKLLIDFQ